MGEGDVAGAVVEENIKIVGERCDVGTAVAVEVANGSGHCFYNCARIYRAIPLEGTVTIPQQHSAHGSQVGLVIAVEIRDEDRSEGTDSNRAVLKVVVSGSEGSISVAQENLDKRDQGGEA